jgi:hypothetical protein
MQSSLLSTRQLCEQIGASHTQIMNGLRPGGKLRPPTHRNARGDLLWTREEAEAARVALATNRRPVRKAVTA